MSDIDTNGTDEVVCPCCGHEHGDRWEYALDESSNIDCEECRRPFFAERITSVTYRTEKIKDAADD